MNRLADSTSPYLRAHADQPVDWRPWGEEAFAEARRRDVPLLISIGYSTCHWCHVMARESFSDPDIAAQINRGFVPVKVDREELPNVDAQYMNALQAMRGQGGWPLTAFADPDGVPFFLGTYFPPQQRMNMPGFPMVLQAVANTWAEQRDKVSGITEKMRDTLQQAAAYLPAAHPGGAAADAPELSGDDLEAQYQTLMDSADANSGGFGAAPKFPPLMTLMALIKGHRRNPDRLEFIRRTFLSMASRGLRDHVAGGIFRYCVDARWTVPHFEKMLYDNALYLRAASAWFGLEESLSPGSRWSRLARREAVDTAEFLLSDMRLDSGGFATALDADSLDSEGNSAEGAHYLEPDEAPLASTPYLRVFADGLGFMLHAPGIEEWAEGGHADEAPWQTEASADALEALRRARTQRPKPKRDDKLITAHTAMAAAALEFASAVFEKPDWHEAAQAAYRAALSLRTEDGLARSATGGVHGPGAAGLADWAQLAGAAAALGDVGTARELLEQLRGRFLDGSVRDYEHDPLLAADGVSAFDDTEPSGVSAAAHAALSTGLLDDSAEWLQTAEELVRSVAPVMYSAPRAAGWLQVTAEGLLSPVRVESDDPHLLALGAADPATTVLSRRAPGSDVGQPQSGAATVCRGAECSLPTADPGELARLLEGASGS